MFNALWLNAQELNGSGMLQRIIALESSVSAGAAVQGTLYRRKGLRATATAGADSLVRLARGRTMRANAAAGAYLLADAHLSPRRMLRSEAYVLTYAVLGAGFAKLMAADVIAGASAIMYPYAALFEADVVAGASIADPVLVRTKKLRGSNSAGAVVDALPPLVLRQCFALPRCGASAVGSPDYIVDGIRWAEFGAAPVLGADAECTIDPTKFLRANVTVQTSGFVAPVVNRYVHLRSNPQLATAMVVFPALQARRLVSGMPVSVGVTAQATAYRDAPLRAVPRQAGARTNMPRVSRFMRIAGGGAVVVSPGPAGLEQYVGLTAAASAGAPLAMATASMAERLYGETTVAVQASLPVIRAALRLAGESLCGISGVAAADVKLAVRLASAVAAGASAEEDGYFTFRLFGGEAMLSATADAIALYRRVRFDTAVATDTVATLRMWVNLFEFAPEYRTLAVEMVERVVAVEPRESTLTVTDDDTPMQTFTKQPREVLDFDIDLAPWFATMPGDDIEEAECDIVAATSGAVSELNLDNLVIVRSVESDPDSPAYRVKVWLSGGLDGVTYKLRATIDTESGRRKEVDFKLKVKDA